MDDTAPGARLSWLAVAAGSALCASVAAIGGDARWLAALGRTIAQAGRIPSAIPYGAAPSQDWVNVPVLGELIFHWLETLAGDRGLLLAQGVAVAATLVLLLRDMRAAGAPDGARALVIMAIPFAATAALFVVRAQLFSLPLFALTMLLLRGDARRRSRRIWLLVPLVALWSNLHGAVLIGLVVAGVYLLLERVRHERWRSVLVLAASFCALFATPALLRTGDYYLGVLRSEPAASGFGLWAPLSLHNPLDVLFVAVALPFLWFAVRARPRLWELAALAILAAATLHVGRNSVWFVLFAAVPAAVGLGETRVSTARSGRRVVELCAWCLPVLLVLFSLAKGPEQTVAGERLRSEAVSLAGGAPILADAEDAEQLALDGRKVWISNPIDAFDRADQRVYLRWLEGRPAGDSLLRAHRVVLLLDGSKPQRRLARDPHFREVARDSRSVLYARRAPG